MQIRLCQQVLEEIERRSVQPLQVVEEQRQRMLRSGEDAEQAPEHQLEPALCVLRWQLRRRRLRADEEFEIGEQRHHERAVQAKRCGKRGAPGRQFGLALPQQRPDQVPAGLAPGWRRECHACIGRTCRMRTVRAAARARGAAH